MENLDWKTSIVGVHFVLLEFSPNAFFAIGLNFKIIRIKAVKLGTQLHIDDHALNIFEVT